jgi:spermidine synthase
LLALEIVASRVIAPYFGNSVYVWGSLIGVFLAALSLGYYVGGRIATRWPQPGPFLALVLAGGAATFPIPHVAAGLLADIAGRDLGPRWGPLLGSAELFFIPALLMATVSPYAVRLKARTVEGVGNVAGMLYALSTLGSIAGTLLAAFVLISWLGVRSIIQVLGAVEMGLAVLGFVWARRAVPAAVAAGTVAAILAVATSTPPDGSDVVYARDTVYHRITVSDEGSVRYLRLDRYWQSARDRATPLRTVFSYTDYLQLPLALIPHPQRVLFVGMGGGTAPSRFFHDYPDLRIDIVELDPAVADTALRWFDLPRAPRLTVHIGDGRLWLRRTRDRFDLIILDAYLIDTIPFHLATREFYAEAGAHLSPGGAVAANVIGATRGPQSRLFRAIDKTFASVFPAVYVFPVDGDAGEAPQNIIIAGTMGPRLDAGQVRARAGALVAAGRVTMPTFVQDADSLLVRPVETGDVPLLTDDFAPTDVLAEPQR